MKPSANYILKVKEYLKKERKTIPEYSVFGDNNWETLDSQLFFIDRALNGFPVEIDSKNYNDEVYECQLWLNHGDEISCWGKDCIS